jgi:tRNA-specific 2-thiouridylase
MTARNGLPVFVRVRSTGAPHPAALHATADGFEVSLDDGEEGVAPGQACVIYDSADNEARLLGGGVIKRAASMGKRAPADQSGPYAEAVR